MAGTPRTLAEVLEVVARNATARIFKALPAKVEAYDAATNLVSATLVVKLPFFDVDGEPEYDDPPTLSVPVLWPRGGGMVSTMPLAPGDFVLLVFLDLSIAEWRASGQTSEPIDTRRHSIGYAYAIPGAFPDVLPLDPTDLAKRRTCMVLGQDGGDAQIVVDASNPVLPTVSIGRGAADYVALASKVDAVFAAIATTVISPGDGGAAIKTAVAGVLATSPSVAAKVAKAK